MRSANLADCAAIAEMHRSNIDKSFLGTLGVGFLKILYQALLLYQGGVLIVAEEVGRVVGFVSGVDNVKPFYKFFLRRKGLSATCALVPKLFSWVNWKRIFETFRYGSHHVDIALPDAELLSIAVDAKYRGQGISAQLFKQLADTFFARGIDKFKIIVGTDLLPAHRFYEKMGCVELSSTEIHKGATSQILVYTDPTSQRIC